VIASPIHVCHVLLSLDPGGLENGVVNVINGLPRDIFRSSVICLQQSGEFAARIANPGVSIMAMHLQPGNDPIMPFRVARVMRTLRPDIVHTRNIEAFFYGATAALLARVPRIIHSEHGRTFPESALRAFVQRNLLRVTDHAFAVSAKLRDDLSAYIGAPRDKYAVLYNGVDLTRFTDPSTQDAGFRPTASEVRIVTVGRLVPVKNYPLLLRSLATLTNLPWQCQLVGEGPEREALHRLAAELGIETRVSFAGHSDDVATILKQADIFVLPSFSEGLSNTLLEAMAAGTAVIASQVGGNGEIIADKVSGMLFPSDDAEALASTLSRLLVDAALRHKLGEAAMHRVQQDFAMSTMLNNYADMYMRVAGRQAEPPLT
jgi:sugar transferase (PEP-CTERM/EpsH1 system associated)